MPPLEGVSLRYGFCDDEECNKITECVAIKMSLFSFRVENLNRGNTCDRDSFFGCYVKSESREIRDVTTIQAGGLVFLRASFAELFSASVASLYLKNISFNPLWVIFEAAQRPSDLFHEEYVILSWIKVATSSG